MLQLTGFARDFGNRGQSAFPHKQTGELGSLRDAGYYANIFGKMRWAGVSGNVNLISEPLQLNRFGGRGFGI